MKNLETKQNDGHLKSIASLSADQIRDVVVRRVKEWCAGMSLYDD